MQIDRFEGRYRFLSNFFEQEIYYDEMRYPSAEHAFQAQKSLDPSWQVKIRFADTPGQAKRLGRSAPLRDDWEKVKLGVMLNILRKKFQHPVLKHKLIETGTRELIEGNNWGDMYWGRCNGIGSNHLGRLLMKIREELIEEEAKIGA